MIKDFSNILTWLNSITEKKNPFHSKHILKGDIRYFGWIHYIEMSNWGFMLAGFLTGIIHSFDFLGCNYY